MSDQLFVNVNTSYNPKSFGSWVRRLRLKRGYSQKQLGAALGKSHSWVCEFEKGRRGLRMQDPEFYVAMAEYMKVPISAILDAANIPKTKADERHFQVYKMLRNRAITRRVISSIDTLQNTSDEIEVLITNSSSRLRSLSHTLQSQIIELKTALNIL